MNTFLQKIIKICLVFAFILLPGSVFAMPQGASVVSGNANFNDLGTTLEINQTTDQLIVNYDDFSINANETVCFNQPSASSMALNRVVQANPSEILGTLSSNGMIFLVNPNGILFGSNATVDVGGLVASTLDISNTDFLNRNYVFSGADGKIENYGSLRANQVGGYIALLSPHVRNSGVVLAALGKAVLTAGEETTLDLDANGLISVVVDKSVTGNPSGADAAIDNQGTISGDGGEIILTAKTLDAVFDKAINNSGIIEAKTMRGVDGKISLLADQNIAVAGRVEGGDVSIVSTDDNVVHSLSSLEGGMKGEVKTKNGGDFRGYAGNDYIFENGTTVESASGDIDVLAQNDVLLSGTSLQSDASVFLTAKNGAIDQSSGQVSAENLVLSADKGISADFLSVDKLSAVNTSQGDIVVKNGKDLQAADLSGLTELNSGVEGRTGIVNEAWGGIIDLTVLGKMSVNEMIRTLHGNIVLNADGNVVQTGDGNIVIAGNSDPEGLPKPVNLDSPSHVPGVGSSDNTVDVTWQVEDPAFKTSPANFQATAGGDYVMNSGTKVEANNGDATVNAQGNVRLSLIDANMGGVSVTSTNGSILDQDMDVVPEDYDVIAHTIKLLADNGTVGGPGAEEQIDVANPYDFSSLWIEDQNVAVDNVPDQGYTSSLDENGEWVFAQTSGPLAESDNWWFHVATVANEKIFEQASIGPFVIASEPNSNLESRGYGDEYQDEKPVYYEILAPSQFLTFEPATALGLYAYHPLTPIDESAFDNIRLDSDAYEFIEENIRKKNFPAYFGE